MYETQRAENNWKYMKCLHIKTLFRLTLIRLSLCLEELIGIFFFFFSYFCFIVKLICELRHKFFFNLQLWQINYLRPLALFLRNLRSAADKFTQSAVCGKTYTPHPFTITHYRNFLVSHGLTG